MDLVASGKRNREKEFGLYSGKALLDLSRIVFGGMVVGGFMSDEVNPFVIFAGLVFSAYAFLLSFDLTYKNRKVV